jgi:two-component system chemotaxis response regulator CheY
MTTNPLATTCDAARFGHLVDPGMPVIMSPTELEHPATVLVVDDEPDMRMLACTVLTAAGFQIAAEAANGHDALAKLRTMQPPQVPTVVLLDNQMPGPRGLDVAAQIRAEHGDQLIVLFSAYLSQDVVAEATMLGIEPVSKTDMMRLGTIMADLVAAKHYNRAK